MSGPVRRIGRPPRGGVARTDAERQAEMQARHAAVPVRVCADRERRARLEADPVAWLSYYLHATYYRPFDQPHIGIINNVLVASNTGGRFAVAGERGIGKSVVLWGMVLYLALTRRQRFPVCLPWAAGAMKRAFSFWRNALCFNERLAEDYPEFCDPFRHSQGVAQRMLSQTWEDTGRSVGARLQVGDGMIVFPVGLGAIGGSTINGNPRGLNLPQEDGSVLRPTLALIDDPQDRKTAKSAALINEAIDKIDGDIAGMGEAGRDLPMLISGNCIRPGDVMEHYLEADGWESLKIPCVLRWPDGWEVEGGKPGPARLLWDEWWDRFRGDEEEGLAYYAENHEAMTAGMVLSSPNSYKTDSKTPDAYYGALRSYYKMGHAAFWAEKQQQPLKRESESGPYELKASLIVGRTDKGRPAGAVPEWATMTLATTDLNPSYGLTWGAFGMGADETAAVLAYGVFRDAPLPIPGDTPAPERAKRVYEALSILGRKLAAMPCKIETWGIDASGTDFDAVLRFASASASVCGIQAVAMTGRGWKSYRPYGKSVFGQPREKCHMAIDQTVRPPRKWLVFHADYWREVGQKAWLGEAGAPGTITLPAGVHVEFAEQVCRERLAGKDEVGGQTVWVWNTQPGPHDYGDVVTMAYALAAWGGIGTGGKVARPAGRVKIVRNRDPRRVSSVEME